MFFHLIILCGFLVWTGLKKIATSVKCHSVKKKNIKKNADNKVTNINEQWYIQEKGAYSNKHNSI